MAAISSGFFTRRKRPHLVALLQLEQLSSWTSLQILPFKPRCSEQDSGLGTAPGPAEQRVHTPRHPRGLQDPEATSRLKRKGSRCLAYIALEKKIMKQFPCRVLKRELLRSDGLLGAGTKGLSSPAASSCSPSR